MMKLFSVTAGSANRTSMCLIISKNWILGSVKPRFLMLRLLFIHPPAPWVGSQPCGAKYPGFCADSKGV